MSEYLAIAVRHAHAQEERLKSKNKLRESKRWKRWGGWLGESPTTSNNLLTAMMIYCGLLSSALGKHTLTWH